MKPKILVVTTVHWPDDTRIRERLIRTLSRTFEVEYASRSPGPTDRSGLEWVALPGGRIQRWLAALRVCIGRDWSVLVIHDPELIPIGMISRWTKRRPVVFDVHEDFPATAMTRPWVPDVLRKPLAVAARWALKAAERALKLTLAEENYRCLFRFDHPVFPNYPDTSGFPDPSGGELSVAYLGDVTVERGAITAARASRLAGVPLVFVGRVPEALAKELRDESGGEVSFAGQLPNAEALEVVRRAGAGLSPLHDSPNYRHSTPTKILEYLALGLPVVASDLPGTRELLDDLDAIQLVPPGDVDALANAIQAILDPGTRALAAAQAQRIREQFRWPGDAVVQFYASLV